MKRFKKWKITIIIPIMLLLSVFTAACGRSQNLSVEAEAGKQSASAAEEKMPVAAVSDAELHLPGSGYEQLLLCNGWFYALRYIYDIDTKETMWQLLRSRFPEIDHLEPYIAIAEGDEPLTVMADRSGNGYLFCASEGDFCLEKYGADGGRLWRQAVPADWLEGRGEAVLGGKATDDGRVFLFWGDGKIGSFHDDGSFDKVQESGLETLEGLALGNGGQVYAYCLTGEEALFREVTGQEPAKTLAERPLQVYDGYEDGIYVRTGEGIWRYDPSGGSMDLLWEWDGTYVQMHGELVQMVDRGEEGFAMVSWAYHWSLGMKLASLTFESALEYPEKQVITLGCPGNAGRIEQLARQYNREDRPYQIRLVQYGEAEKDGLTWTREGQQEFWLAVAQGDGPDIMEVSSCDMEGLAKNGIFADLSEYFEESPVVHEDDLLEQVETAGQVEGRMYFVIPSFWLETYVGKQQMAREDWTIEEAISQALDEGQGCLLNGMSPRRLYALCMADAGARFIDYRQGRSRFDSQEFLALLEALGKVGDTDRLYEESGDVREVWSKFMESESRMRWESVTSIRDYLEAEEACNGEIAWLGYPGQEGGWHLLRPYDILAINAASANQEGAWDFLEYTLSKEIQEAWKDGFPVRADSIEVWLKEAPLDKLCDSKLIYEVDEEDYEAIMEMLEETAYYPETRPGSPVEVILGEEVTMYLEGDAAALETAEKIQNRIMLWLENG